MLNFHNENQTGANTEHCVVRESYRVCINFSVILLNTDNKEIGL